jgi:glutamyl-tRNA reductase
LSVREAIAVSEEEIPGILHSLVANDEISEAVWLSTCNRVEVYLVPASDAVALSDVVNLVQKVRGVDDDTFQEHGYILQGREAVSHLLKVAASLDSMVVGEPQILGQVKTAAQLARRAETMGPILNRVLQFATQAAKRVRTQTGIGKMRVSVGSVAVDLARRIFGHLDTCRVLLVGAGKMGELTGRSLSRAGAARVYVTNRSADRARQVADRYEWSARNFDELEELLARVDVVLTSTAAANAIITTRMIRRVIRARKYRPLFIVDIAVPRDVEPEVGDLDTVYLYNVDDLVAISDANQDARRAEVEAAEGLLESAAADIEAWFHSLEVQPTLLALRSHAKSVVEQELEKSFAKRLKHLSEDDRAAMEQAMNAMLAKLLHPAMIALKSGAQQRGAAGLVAAARLLYGLDEPEEALASNDEEPES